MKSIFKKLLTITIVFDIIILGKIFENCENINLHDNINSVAKELHLEATSIWSLVSGITNKIAKERRLL